MRNGLPGSHNSSVCRLAFYDPFELGIITISGIYENDASQLSRLPRSFSSTEENLWKIYEILVAKAVALLLCVRFYHKLFLQSLRLLSPFKKINALKIIWIKLTKLQIFLWGITELIFIWLWSLSAIKELIGISRDLKEEERNGGLGGTTGSASDSRSKGRGFDSH